MNNQWTLWILAATALTATLSAANSGPDLLITAAELTARAEQRSQACDYETAGSLIKQALSSLDRFESSSETARGTAGNLRAQLIAQRKELTETRRFWDGKASRIDKLIGNRRFREALAELDNLSPPLCDTRFHSLRARTQAAAQPRPSTPCHTCRTAIKATAAVAITAGAAFTGLKIYREYNLRHAPRVR